MAKNLAVSPVGSYPTFSPLPSCEGGIFCATFRRRGLWSSPPRLSTGITLNGVRKFLPPSRASDPPAVPEIGYAAAATSCSGLYKMRWQLSQTAKLLSLATSAIIAGESVIWQEPQWPSTTGPPASSLPRERR